jgi:Arc/MetJ-type ribon-helix-helix transcriptional regulator
MAYYPTMPKSKVAVALEKDLLYRIDGLVAERRYPNRSQAIEVAISEKLERLTRGQLAREVSKLSRREERALADAGLSTDGDAWPEIGTAACSYSVMMCSWARGLTKRSWVKISQVRTLSTERLGKKLARVSEDDLARVIEGLNEIIVD